MLACCLKLRTLVELMIKTFVIFMIASDSVIVGSEARRLKNQNHRSRKQQQKHHDLVRDDDGSSQPPVFLTLKRSERSPTMVLPKGHLPKRPTHGGRRRPMRRITRSKNSHLNILSQSQFQQIYNSNKNTDKNSVRPNQGSTRKMRLWCRIGIGYHLEINRKGKVLARHTTTPDGKYITNKLTTN